MGGNQIDTTPLGTCGGYYVLAVLSAAVGTGTTATPSPAAIDMTLRVQCAVCD